MNLTNGTDINQYHKGAFNDFWSFMANFTFKGLPLTFLYFMCIFTFFGAIIFQPILLIAMIIRPDAQNNTSDSDANTYNQRSIFEPFVEGAKFINRAFGGKNDKAYIIARTLGYVGGFAASGHVINNMDNDGSPEFVLKSVLLFDGITIASAVAGNYVLGKTLDKCVNSKQCPEILTRFKESRNSGLLNSSYAQEDEADELIPTRQFLNDSEEDLENSTLSSGSTNTLTLHS